jgi:glycosyltransferase involved in cell wall biosynthesis
MNDVPTSTYNILQVSTSDGNGGAENVAKQLAAKYREQGHNSWLAVGRKESHDPNVFQIDNENKAYRRFDGLAKRFLAHRLGRECFYFPGTAHILEQLPTKPDIIHCHNLHGDYFDLRELPNFNLETPIMLTLHDAWLLAGHCAHSFECNRWQMGCGKCPRLDIYPSMERDATAENIKKKHDIFSRCRLYVTSPSKWLLNKATHSILKEAIIDSQVIPNGINTSIFKPANKQKAKEELATKLTINKDDIILIFAANGIRNNVFKDYKTLRAAITKTQKTLNQNVVFIALGEDAPKEVIDGATIYFVPFEKDPVQVAKYYQAADVYLHAAHAEVWGLTIGEALACGVPVVATAVGGIPEQVKDGINGYLVAHEDSDEMAKCVVHLVNNNELRETMSKNATTLIQQNFTIDMQVSRYLKFYDKIIQHGKHIYK